MNLSGDSTLNNIQNVGAIQEIFIELELWIICTCVLQLTHWMYDETTNKNNNNKTPTAKEKRKKGYNNWHDSNVLRQVTNLKKEDTPHKLYIQRENQEKEIENKKKKNSAQVWCHSKATAIYFYIYIYVNIYILWNFKQLCFCFKLLKSSAVIK